MTRGVSRHDEVFKYLKAFEIKNYRMPTTKEVCYDIKISKGPLYRILLSLADKGFLKHVPTHTIPYKVIK